MTLYYSKSSNGFFDSDINTIIPGDSVTITSSQHQALLQAQSAGQVITVDSSGNPVAQDPPKPSLDDYKTTAKALIDVERKNAEEQGMPYTFPDGDKDVVQLRDNRDLLNISSLTMVSQMLISQNVTTPIPFQGLSNVSHPMTPTEMAAMGLEVASYVQSLYSVSWPIKAAIDAAVDYAGVDAVAVWPSTSS